MDRTYYNDLKANIMELTPGTVFYIGLTLKVLFLGFLLKAQSSFKKLVSDENRELYTWAIFAMYWNFIIVINPLAWKHSMVALVFSWVVLGLYWLKGVKLVRREKVLLYSSLGLILIFASRFIWGTFQRETFAKIGPDFLGIVCLSLGLYFCTKRVMAHK